MTVVETGTAPPALAASAAYILRGNDIGTLTTAAPRLYPHLWSWDAAFVAIGLATVSVPRAIAELRTLLGAQWTTGMLPHIVFGPDEGYFPGPDVWGATTPSGARTSGICQPPVHAIAVRRVLDAGRRNGGADRDLAERFAAETFDRWLAWHRWLATARDPRGRGLLEIYHGWESGMDNSPRWDRAYSSVQPREDLLRGRARRDLEHVADARQRPTDEEYRRYLWLVHQMREARYDDDAVRETVDFRMTDVFMSAVAALASDVLAEIGDEVGRPAEAAELRALAARFRGGVLSTVSPSTGLARDEDVRTGLLLDAPTIGGFAPLLCGGDPAVISRQLALFTGPEWCGHPGLRYALPPSTAPDHNGFSPRTYWRGPQWPFMNWLLYWTLYRAGEVDLALSLREQGLRQLGDRRFGEYYEPLTGEPLGSAHQSWTAAVALDWLIVPPAG
jgi:hypothetical protein